MRPTFLKKRYRYLDEWELQYYKFLVEVSNIVINFHRTHFYHNQRGCADYLGISIRKLRRIERLKCHNLKQDELVDILSKMDYQLAVSPK